MNFQNYNLTPSAKKALQSSKKIAKKFGHLKVIDIHLLYSISEQSHTNLNYVFSKNYIDKTSFLKTLESILELYKEPRRKKEIYSDEIKDALAEAEKISKKQKSDYIGVDHIFYGVLKSSSNVQQLLLNGGVDPEEVMKDLNDVFKNGVEHVPATNAINPRQDKSNKTLEDFCENITEKCREKNSEEIFGRDKEINRLYEILLKRNKCNAILVGDAGVGKTAIVEGLAEKIVSRKCPDLLLNKEIYCLDITNILAGTIYRGQMEEKIKSILEMVKNRPNIILFIDEIHTIIGAGSGSEGGLDLANILKPALSRGEISCIGATTIQEYDKFFKRDSALNRRFEKIEVQEPSKEETFDLLLSSKSSYEDFHMVEYSSEVIRLIIDLCNDHLPSKKFPDKAFDILDESGAKTKMEKIVRPAKAVEMEKKLLDPEFQKDLDKFNKLQKRYFTLLQKWGESLENKKFNVDKEVIYSIFASKLETSIENVKNNENIYVAGKIGF